MAYNQLQKPTGKIVERGNPLVLEHKVDSTGPALPGRLVYKGTNDDDAGVKSATDNVTNMPIGWLGYEQASASYKPSDEDTAYSTGDFAPVLNGGHFIIVSALSAVNATKGQYLCAGESGMLTAVTTEGTASMKSVPIAIAMESVNASTSITDCAVLSLI